MSNLIKKFQVIFHLLVLKLTTQEINNDIIITDCNRKIKNMKVVIDQLEHTWVGDLEITLTNVKTGTSVILLNKPELVLMEVEEIIIGTVFSDLGMKSMIQLVVKILLIPVSIILLTMKSAHLMEKI